MYASLFTQMRRESLNLTSTNERREETEIRIRSASRKFVVVPPGALMSPEPELLRVAAIRASQLNVARAIQI